MKAKHILILCGTHIKGKVAGEAMFSKIMEQLHHEGKQHSVTIENPKEKFAKFRDGSKITIMSVGSPAIGRRFTHIYIDESVFEMANAETYINEAVLPSVIRKGSYINWDADEDDAERIYSFNLSEEGVKTKILNKGEQR